MMPLLHRFYSVLIMLRSDIYVVGYLTFESERQRRDEHIQLHEGARLRMKQITLFSRINLDFPVLDFNTLEFD